MKILEDFLNLPNQEFDVKYQEQIVNLRREKVKGEYKITLCIVSTESSYVVIKWDNKEEQYTGEIHEK